MKTDEHRSGARRLTRWDGLALLLACALLVASAAPWIRHLGMEYDEAHFHEEATRIAYGHERILRPPDGVTLAGRPFPFMTMPYVGGLDAWLLAVPFRLAGTGPVATRSAHLALGCCVLVAAYLLAMRLGGRTAAWIAVGMLLADLEFLLHVPVHYGPFLLQMIAAPLVVWSLENWLAAGRARWLCAAAALAAVGLNEKLTFVFVLAPLALGYAALRWRQIRQVWSWRAVALAAVCGGLLLAPVLIYINGHRAEVFGFGRETVAGNTVTAARWWTFYQLLTGQEFVRQQLGGVGVGRVSLLAVVLALAVAVAMARRHRMAMILLAVPFGVVTITQFLADGGRLHHLLLGYPLLQCGVGVALAQWPRGARMATALLLITGFSTAYNLAWYSSEVRRTGGAGAWSSAIYDLARWADQRMAAAPETQFFTSAWGFRRQLFTLTRGRVEMEEEFFGLLGDEPTGQARQWMERLLTHGAAYYVTTDRQPDFVKTQSHVERDAARLGRVRREVARFGRYSVHTFDGPAGPWKAAVKIAGDFRGADAMIVELLDESNRRTGAWWRSLKYFQPPPSGTALLFAPSLSPRNWRPLRDQPLSEARPARAVVHSDPGGQLRVSEFRVR